MKKIAYTLLAVLLAGAFNGCTNDEADTEFDTLTPVNTTQTQQWDNEIPH